jgi:hypothetical protein
MKLQEVASRGSTFLLASVFEKIEKIEPVSLLIILKVASFTHRSVTL